MKQLLERGLSKKDAGIGIGRALIFVRDRLGSDVRSEQGFVVVTPFAVPFLERLQLGRPTGALRQERIGAGNTLFEPGADLSRWSL
ncbi:MAG: hypothetical protein ACLQFT_18245 [Steroidobacteraceae bacterium]